MGGEREGEAAADTLDDVRLFIRGNREFFVLLVIYRIVM